MLWVHLWLPVGKYIPDNLAIANASGRPCPHVLHVAAAYAVRDDFHGVCATRQAVATGEFAGAPPRALSSLNLAATRRPNRTASRDGRFRATPEN